LFNYTTFKLTPPCGKLKKLDFILLSGIVLIMKVVYILIIFIIVIVSYSVFEQYLTKENLSNVLQLRENKPLAASVSKPTQSNNPSPSQVKNETIKETSTQRQETTDISPYYGKVKISSIRAETNYHPSLITLSIRVYSGDKINITGWRVKTRKGKITISQAIEKYQSSFPLKDIIIEESSTIYLIAGSNPLGLNKNFRANKCFGYLANSRDFYPSIYTYCSGPKLEDVSHLNPICQEFILRSYGCKMPEYSKYFEISTDQECVSYIIDYFTYNACFKRCSKDDNFLKNYWYVYLNENIVEPLHDTIYLYDHNGLIVDKYMY